MVDTQRQIEDLQRQVAQITAEQQRIRDNMKTVAANTEYSNRLLKKLNDQESQIEKLQGELDEARKTLNQQKKDLEAFLIKATVK
jgi:predicted RNase H-like nuclease (RuvC/YqgF family)